MNTNNDNDNNATKDTIDRANILGMHLEGPYFANEKRGAHSCDCIRHDMPNNNNNNNNTDPNNKNKPKKGSIEDTYGVSNLKQAGVVIVTLAQELDGALSTIQTLTRTQGVVVAMVHTSATLEQGSLVIDHGATLITQHLYCYDAVSSSWVPGLLELPIHDNYTNTSNTTSNSNSNTDTNAYCP